MSCSKTSMKILSMLVMLALMLGVFALAPTAVRSETDDEIIEDVIVDENEDEDEYLEPKDEIIEEPEDDPDLYIPETADSTTMNLAMDPADIMPTAAIILPAPTNVQWAGVTGSGEWDQVPNSGVAEYHTGSYKYRIYFTGSNPTAPSDVDQYHVESSINTNHTGSTFSCNFSNHFTEGDGYYFFAVAARGNGVGYLQSDFAMSDGFYYTAPTDPLPKPADLDWKIDTSSGTARYIATWDDHADYDDDDVASVTIYRGSNEIGGNLWTIGEVRYEALGGMDITSHVSGNGDYRFTVQIQSSRPLEFLSSVESDLSDPLPIRSGGGGGSRSSGGNGGSNISTPRTTISTTTSAPVTQTASTIATLATTAAASGSTTAESTGTGEVTVQASAWSQLSGLSFRHDTVINGAVQVRITISDPASINQDLKVSGYTTGAAVEAVSSTFNQHFSNTTSVMHLDQTGSFGQPVRIAAKFDLTGMNTDNLVFYSYNAATNSYNRIENPNYTIDSNGYTHFTTSIAGDIIVSDGPLVKK